LTLAQLEREILGEAGTFVSVLLQRHSQLLETTLLRIEQPRATSMKHMPTPLSPVLDDTDKVAQAIRGFDTDNAHLRTSLNSVQSQLTGACCVDIAIASVSVFLCPFHAITAAQSEIQTLRHTLTDRCAAPHWSTQSRLTHHRELELMEIKAQRNNATAINSDTVMMKQSGFNELRSRIEVLVADNESMRTLLSSLVPALRRLQKEGPSSMLSNVPINSPLAPHHAQAFHSSPQKLSTRLIPQGFSLQQQQPTLRASGPVPSTQPPYPLPSTSATLRLSTRSNGNGGSNMMRSSSSSVMPTNAQGYFMAWSVLVPQRPQTCPVLLGANYFQKLWTRAEKFITSSLFLSFKDLVGPMMRQLLCKTKKCAKQLARMRVPHLFTNRPLPRLQLYSRFFPTELDELFFLHIYR
jgi:hypothetical protein